MDVQRISDVVGKLCYEIDSRDKILDIIINGGNVTFVNEDSPTVDENGKAKSSRSGTNIKTFEIFTKTVPFKVETVKITQTDWNECFNLMRLQNENSGISLFSDDVKPHMKSDTILKSPSVNLNVEQNAVSLPTKRRLFASDSKSIEELAPINKKQTKIDKKEDYYDFLSDLSEFSVDKTFFEFKDSSSTLRSKFLIRLHDNNIKKIRMFTINRYMSTKSVSVQKFDISLDEIEDTLNEFQSCNPMTKIQIWIDMKNFDRIFTHPKLKSDEACTFLKFIGEKVSHFTFCQLHNGKTKPSLYVNSNLLVDFILYHFPNLKYLTMKMEMLNNLNDLQLGCELNVTSSSKPIKLKKLETLKIINSGTDSSRISSRFIAKLLERTPRLESIYGIPLNCIKEVVKLDKITIQHPLNSSDFGPSTPKLKIRAFFVNKSIYIQQSHKFYEDLLDLYNLSTDSGTRGGRMIIYLEEFNSQRHLISNCVIREKVSKIISKILKDNEKSLRRLTLEPSPNAETAIDLPRLQNLKFLKFQTKIGNYPSFFHRGFWLKHIFPKLNEVQIQISVSPKSKTFPEFLNRGEIFDNVDTLILQNLIPSNDDPESESGYIFIRRLRHSFPNLNRLTLNNKLYEISGLLPQIFQHFSNLHQLVLETTTDTRYGNLDSAVTGINVDVCENLQKSEFIPCPIEGRGREKFMRIIQSRPSISDLKGDKPMKIPILTPVSFEYGFNPNQLKKLKIILDIHERRDEQIKSNILTAMGPVLHFMTVL